MLESQSKFFCQKSGGGCRNDETRPRLWVSANVSPSVLLQGDRKNISSMKYLRHLSPKVISRNKSRKKTESELAKQVHLANGPR